MVVRGPQFLVLGVGCGLGDAVIEHTPGSEGQLWEPQVGWPERHGGRVTLSKGHPAWLTLEGEVQQLSPPNLSVLMLSL